MKINGLNVVIFVLGIFAIAGIFEFIHYESWWPIIPGFIWGYIGRKYFPILEKK